MQIFQADWLKIMFPKKNIKTRQTRQRINISLKKSFYMNISWFYSREQTQILNKIIHFVAPKKIRRLVSYTTQHWGESSVAA